MRPLPPAPSAEEAAAAAARAGKAGASAAGKPGAAAGGKGGKGGAAAGAAPVMRNAFLQGLLEAVQEYVDVWQEYEPTDPTLALREWGSSGSGWLLFFELPGLPFACRSRPPPAQLGASRPSPQCPQGELPAPAETACLAVLSCPAAAVPPELQGLPQPRGGSGWEAYDADMATAEVRGLVGWGGRMDIR